MSGQTSDVKRETIVLERQKLMKSGYAGVNRLGQIVDRRDNPYAIPCQKNPVLDTPDPKPIRAIVYSGNVYDIRSTLSLDGQLTVERLKWEIEEEKRYKNRITVIKMLERNLQKLRNSKEGGHNEDV